MPPFLSQGFIKPKKNRFDIIAQKQTPQPSFLCQQLREKTTKQGIVTDLKLISS
jgi:hypothetical protein